ncbi:MAG: helix-turn-helix domain-containing protein [Litorimonas sp.]
MSVTWPFWSGYASGISYPFFVLFGPILVQHLKAVSGDPVADKSVLQQLPILTWVYFVLCSLTYILVYGLNALEEKSNALYFFATIVSLSISPWTIFHIYKGINLLRFHDLRLKDWFSRVNDKSLSWIRYVLLFSIVAILIDFISMFLGEFASAQSLLRSINTIVLSVVVTSFAYTAILKRAMYNFPEQSSALEISRKTSYSNSGLSNDRLERLLNKLDALMDEKQPYLDPNLSLPKLANALGTTTNHLSQALNQGRGQTFLTFINMHRIDEAQRLMKSSTSNLLHIALASGFNSRSTFNTAFRKHCGKTPSKFRKQDLS